MKKIPTLFKRDFNNNGQIIPEYNEAADWVVRGEGIATLKIDGMCCMIRDGKLYKRHEVKEGKEEPYGFELADVDTNTGKKMGWVEVGNSSEDKYFREAIAPNPPDHAGYPDGTYELLGPKVQGNPENRDSHVLVSHNQTDRFAHVPIEFEELKTWLEGFKGEGIVWHHNDGRMVKIKKKDFRLKR